MDPRTAALILSAIFNSSPSALFVFSSNILDILQTYRKIVIPQYDDDNSNNSNNNTLYHIHVCPFASDAELQSFSLDVVRWILPF